MRAIHTRATALRILNEAGERSFFSGALKRAATDRKVNYPLLQRLVKGTTEWRGRIDEELGAVLSVPLEGLPPAVQNILRLAAYQILFLERVPLDRVREESCALATEHRAARHVPLIKRTLELLTNRPKAGLGRPGAPLASPGAVARHFSHPEWLVERLAAEIGLEETARFCAANNQPWPVVIRANTLRISPRQLQKRLVADGIPAKPVRLVPECLELGSLRGDRRLHTLEAFRRGLFQVQDPSAALIGLLAEPRPGQSVLDLCAAPGGKTTHLATLMRDRGRILALDLDPDRLKLVEQNGRRLGLGSIRTRPGDALTMKLEPVDLVLLDAPCSGFGVLGRKSDIRWTKHESTIAELVALQRRLFARAAKLVRPGGTLIYSTCTVLRAENEAIVAAFLLDHPEFSVAPPPPTVPRQVITPEGYLRTWPHRHRMGGGFGARLVRAE